MMKFGGSLQKSYCVRAFKLNDSTLQRCGIVTSASCYKENHFIQVSTLRTDKFQQSLPRLPIPKLKNTLDRYLDSQRALLSADSPEFRHTESLVRQFEESGAGPKLDQVLRHRDKSNKYTSYIADFWYDAYLKARVPVVFNYNPFIMMKPDTNTEQMDPIVRATNLIVSSLRFRNAHTANCLDPDIYHLNEKKSNTKKFRTVVKYVPDSMAWYVAYLYKAFPLDMSQYPRLFASTRVPRRGRDTLTSQPNARHIVVIRNGHFYTFDVYEPDGHIVDPKRIYANLNYIASLPVDQTDSALSPGLLTTMDRDTWADLREHMVNELGNEPTLSAIDSALFAVCLDSTTSTEVPDIVRQHLCGDPAFRWFDKCFQLIVTPDGQASVNFEHSWGDGVAILRYLNEVRSDTVNKPSISKSSVLSDIPHEGVHRLEFHFDDRVKNALQKARESLEATLSKFQVGLCRQSVLNRGIIKAANLSPDAMLQFAIQLAYYRLTGGGVAPTYESCSTAAFRHGRTETIRSATCETRDACKLIGDASLSGAVSAEHIHALRKCSTKHSQLTKEAAMGQGWDRHLYALKTLAEMELGNAREAAADKGGEQLPAIFTDPSYKKINNIILSTSTLSSPNIQLGGFAPVIPDGFGFGYGIVDDEAGGCITAYKGDNKYTAQSLADSFESALKTVGHIVQATANSSKK